MGLSSPSARNPFAVWLAGTGALAVIDAEAFAISRLLALIAAHGARAHIPTRKGRKVRPSPVERFIDEREGVRTIAARYRKPPPKCHRYRRAGVRPAPDQAL